MKYFVISDIHSYYTIMIEALLKAGYDETNPDHKIVLLGDAFDRGEESLEMYNWLLDKCKNDKIIYVKGNHEELMRNLLDRRYSERHDVHNHTDSSIWQLAGANLIEHHPAWGDAYDMPFEKACEIVEPMFTELEKYMVDYFETEHYIGVHSWIPTSAKMDPSPAYEKLSKIYRPYIDVYNPNWREAGNYDWSEARWVNPFKMATDDLNQTGKTIIFGHWHCSRFWSIKELRTEFYDDAKWDIAVDEKHNTIGIDRCTAHTKECNVLVIED